MMPVTFELVGAKELEDALRKLPLALQEKVVDQAVRAGAKIVLAEMLKGTPVRAGSRGIRTSALSRKFRFPGNLKANMKIRKVPRSKHNYAGQVVVGAMGPGYYGMFHEFGTARLPARPFMRPALDRTVQPALEAMGKALGKAIEREALRLGSRMTAAQRRRAFRKG